jgi:hypothetical protein
MKLTSIALLAFVGYASAAKPQLSISVKDGNYGGLDGLSPTISWEGSNTAGDLDLSYGIEASAAPTTDLASLPKSVWGKAKTSVSGWGVSARAEIDAQKLDSADLELDADNSDLDLSVRAVARAGQEFSVNRIEGTKGFDANGARVTVNPRFNLENDERDVVVNWSNDGTSVKLTASVDDQEVTVSRQIDDNNRIAPTVNRNGQFSVEWERRLGDDSRLTANLKPNDSLDVEWKDDAWTASVNMPIEGTNINGANVSIKRDVKF